MVTSMDADGTRASNATSARSLGRARRIIGLGISPGFSRKSLRSTRIRALRVEKSFFLYFSPSSMQTSPLLTVSLLA